MAPGCFTLEQSQKVNNFNADTNTNTTMNTNDMLILNETSYDLDSNIFTTAAKYSTSEILKNSNLKKPKSFFPHIFTSYHHEINLDTIPLPSTPYPYPYEEEHSTTTTTTSTTTNTKLCDTVDSFEILEQTIMKQKRLARSKHVDMRRKVLLKRTFDLVCEIMDHENGFEEGEEVDEDGEQSKHLLNINTPKESLDLVESDSNTNTLPNLVNLVYLDTTSIRNCTSQQQQQVDTDVGAQNTDKLLRTILNEKTQFNTNSSSSSSSSSSLAQLTTFTSSSQKRKHSLSSSLSLSNKKIKLQSQQQRRPSNSDDDDEEEEEEEDEEEEDEDEEYNENEANFICLFDDDNDPFGIADVVNLTSFKTTTTY
jgi:hypothetical protein